MPSNKSHAELTSSLAAGACSSRTEMISSLYLIVELPTAPLEAVAR